MEIKEEQQRQWAVLKDLQARLPGQRINEEEEDVEDLDMDLPLRTLEQLDEMERQLEETGSQKRMVVQMPCTVMLNHPGTLLCECSGPSVTLTSCPNSRFRTCHGWVGLRLTTR